MWINKWKIHLSCVNHFHFECIKWSNKMSCTTSCLQVNSCLENSATKRRNVLPCPFLTWKPGASSGKCFPLARPVSWASLEQGAGAALEDRGNTWAHIAVERLTSKPSTWLSKDLETTSSRSILLNWLQILPRGTNLKSGQSDSFLLQSFIISFRKNKLLRRVHK